MQFNADLRDASSSSVLFSLFNNQMDYSSPEMTSEDLSKMSRTEREASTVSTDLSAFNMLQAGPRTSSVIQNDTVEYYATDFNRLNQSHLQKQPLVTEEDAYTTNYADQVLSIMPPFMDDNTASNTAKMFPPATACTPLFNGSGENTGSLYIRKSVSDLSQMSSECSETSDSVRTSTCSERIPPRGSQTNSNYVLMRGVSGGGFANKPPLLRPEDEGYEFVKCKLSTLNASYDAICAPVWTFKERSEMRRIVRIEREQDRDGVTARFSIVDTTTDSSISKDDDALEVSCLLCACPKSDTDNAEFRYYITSVEVVKIVELLIGGTSRKSKESRRKERGRVRSNLVQFWSKKSINSKRSSEKSTRGHARTEADFKRELAQRIMAYTTRKPRGFDKDVRILEWVKLVPALNRAMQSYYVRMPKR
ncbi:DEKNAAC101280 [Brettanomyces naardenensis]|uniref:DEKNAAC101280 n=1 Tax=Brettanomyces naardenensis TaxID=13370 RepID=A0A448YI14_BRENA|nr:DEKNAAC101280 [Brettanomyces naardenensis]